MQIANRLREHNRAEYLLYLWQVEDLIRAYGGDFDRLRRDYLSRFSMEEDVRRDTEQWYSDLCDMMHSEGKMKGGHLQICQNVLQELEELHRSLLASPKFPYYREMYYKVLPYIVELRQKKQDKAEEELQTCFDALYGVLLLRLQHKPVSAATEQAVKDISALLGQLSDYYFKDRKEPLDFG